MQRRLLRLIWLVFVAVLVSAPFYVWFWWGTLGILNLASVHGASYDVEKLGQTGDLFGGVSALFAAYAFLGAAVAAYYQARTFKHGEEERTQARFEPLFFRLLDRHESSRPDDLLLRVATLHIQSQPFAAVVESLSASFDRAMKPLAWSNLTGSERFGFVDDNYLPFYELNEQPLGPYFRSLFHIFQFIDGSRISAQEKVRYANIARSTLNVFELRLLALNCASKLGRDDFKPLVETYGLLKHLHRRSAGFAVNEVVDTLYRKTARLGTRGRLVHWRERPRQRPKTMDELG